MKLLIFDRWEMRFSIVVPVYNTKKYLKTSLDSIVGQTFNEYEVVVVNDGSTDDSMNIVNEYAMKYGFKVIDKPNKGCYAARVDGIINCKGEYIINLDSDDCFSSDTVLAELDKRLRKINDPDVLIYGYNEMSDNGKITKTNYRKRQSYIGDKCKEFYKRFFATTEYNSIWSKVFRKELFSAELIINKRINMCEDVFISLNILESASSIECVEDVFYNYRINPTSLVREYKKSDSVNVLVYEKMSEFISRKGLDKEFLEIASMRFLKDCAVTYLLAPNNINGKSDCYKSDLCEIASNPIYQKVCGDYLSKQSSCIRFINKLILKKKLRMIVFFKRFFQIKSINKLMRKVYGKA